MASAGTSLGVLAALRPPAWLGADGSGGEGRRTGGRAASRVRDPRPLPSPKLLLGIGGRRTGVGSCVSVPGPFMTWVVRAVLWLVLAGGPRGREKQMSASRPPATFGLRTASGHDGRIPV